MRKPDRKHTSDDEILTQLVGMLTPEEADRAEQRSREWRDRFDHEMGIEETDTEGA